MAGATFAFTTRARSQSATALRDSAVGSRISSRVHRECTSISSSTPVRISRFPILFEPQDSATNGTGNAILVVPHDDSDSRRLFRVQRQLDQLDLAAR